MFGTDIKWARAAIAFSNSGSIRADINRGKRSWLSVVKITSTYIIYQAYFYIPCLPERQLEVILFDKSRNIRKLCSL